VTPGTLFWLALASLSLGCFAAIGARVLQDLSWHELEDWCQRRGDPKRFRQILDLHEEVAVAAENLRAVCTATFLVSGAIWITISESVETDVSWYVLGEAVALGALLLWPTTVWIPSAVDRLLAIPFLFRTWRIWLATNQLLKPLGWCATLVDITMQRLSGKTDEPQDEEEAFEDEIRTMVSEGEHEGLLEPDAREMIESVIELGDADVADIMTPRSKVNAIDIRTDWNDALQLVVESGRTRIPVFEKKLENIVGILYVKDLLPELFNAADQPRRPLREILRKAWFVSQTMPVDDLLQKFLTTHSHLAIVVDEYQAITGVVTIEDVLEEIVGEIVDEYDDDVADEIQQFGDHLAESLGQTHLDQLNERLGLELPEDEEFDTVAGLILSSLQRIPAVGDQVLLHGVRLTVLEVTPRRIERVRIETLVSPGRETA